MSSRPVNWVTVPRFCELTGYTVDAVDKKRSNGVWLEGVVWKYAPDNRVQINLEAYDLWVEGSVPQHAQALPSPSSTARSAAGRR